MTLRDILLKNRKSNKYAVKQGKKKYSYQCLNEEVTKHKQRLRKHLNKGNNMAIFLPNSIDYIIAYFTITFLKKVIVPIEKNIKEAMLNSILHYCEVRMIITNQSEYPILVNLLRESNYKIQLYILETQEVYVVGTGNFIMLSEKEHIYDKEDVAIMLHTSGTTSNPKRVMLTHKNLICNLISHIKSLMLNENDRTLIVLPMYFGYCNTSQLLAHLYLGAEIVIYEGELYPRKILKTLEEEKCTNTTFVPSMLGLLISTKCKQYNLANLKYLCFGGGYMPIEQLKYLMEIFPNTGFVQTYGQTEAGPRVTCLLPEDSLRKIGSVGKAIPDVEVVVINENGKRAGINEIGEIIVRGNNVMKGYYKKKKITKQTVKRGWLHTGDMGSLDGDGYLYLKGRKKNIIISGGLNIYPEEIEEVIQQLSEVEEVAVYGEKHILLGEVPIAKIVVKEGSNISINEIYDYMKTRLDSNKIPAKILFYETLEKTTTGKIKR